MTELLLRDGRVPAAIGVLDVQQLTLRHIDHNRAELSESIRYCSNRRVALHLKWRDLCVKFTI